jgi:hypothetical protein
MMILLMTQTQQIIANFNHLKGHYSQLKQLIQIKKIVKAILKWKSSCKTWTSLTNLYPLKELENKK